MRCLQFMCGCMFRLSHSHKIQAVYISCRAHIPEIRKLQRHSPDRDVSRAHSCANVDIHSPNCTGMKKCTWESALSPAARLENQECDLNLRFRHFSHKTVCHAAQAAQRRLSRSLHRAALGDGENINKANGAGWGRAALWDCVYLSPQRNIAFCMAQCVDKTARAFYCSSIL